MHRSLSSCGATLLLAISISGRLPLLEASVPPSSNLHNYAFVPRGGVRQLERKVVPSLADNTANNDTQPFVVEDMVVEGQNVVEDQSVVSTSKEEPAAKSSSPSLLAECLSGMTVALASIPSSIAFAAIAGVDPMVGVWSSVILGAVSSLAGMKAGLIAGSAGVVVVPLAGVLSSHGKQYMGPTILLAAFMEMVFSLAKGGKLINLVSDPVMTGFLNGLGCLLLRSQLKVFMAPGSDGLMPLLPKNELLATTGVTALTSALSLLLPKLLPGQGWPTALLSIVAATVTSQILRLPVARLSIGDEVSSGESTSWYSSLYSFGGTLNEDAGANTRWYNSLPSFAGLPKGDVSLFSSRTLRIVAPAAFSIAVISILETLLAIKVVDEANTDDANDKTVQEEVVVAADRTKDKACMAMALGNVMSALFGGFGGCGLIPQTLLNIQSGGRGAASVLSYAAIMAISILFSSSLLKMVPTASLAGVMILVALRTIQWKPTSKAMFNALSSFKKDSNDRMVTPPRPREFINFAALAVSTLVCFYVDMGSGIILGVLLEKGLPLLLPRA